MKILFSLARTLSIVAAVGASAALVCEPAVAARSGGGHVVAAGGWHGGPGHFRGGHWGHRGYWPGAFWGGIGLGLGIGAVGYYGGYYGYGGYYSPYYGAYYYDPPLIVAPVYGTVDPGAPRTGQPVPQASARGRSDLLSEERPERRSDRVGSARLQSLGDDPARCHGRRQHLPARDARLHGRARLHGQVGAASSRERGGCRRARVTDCACGTASRRKAGQDFTVDGENRR